MDQLVVTSKIKAKVKAMASMNTSAETIDKLTRHVEDVLGKVVESAKADGRKTVMGRDVDEVLNNWK